MHNCWYESDFVSLRNSNVAGAFPGLGVAARQRSAESAPVGRDGQSGGRAEVGQARDRDEQGRRTQATRRGRHVSVAHRGHGEPAVQPGRGPAQVEPNGAARGFAGAVGSAPEMK